MFTGTCYIWMRVSMAKQIMSCWDANQYEWSCFDLGWQICAQNTWRQNVLHFLTGALQNEESASRIHGAHFDWVKRSRNEAVCSFFASLKKSTSSSSMEPWCECLEQYCVGLRELEQELEDDNERFRDSREFGTSFGDARGLDRKSHFSQPQLETNKAMWIRIIITNWIKITL